MEAIEVVLISCVTPNRVMAISEVGDIEGRIEFYKKATQNRSGSNANE